MFEIGDKIIYPMYGAGIIEDIEVKDYDGSAEKYYVIQIPNNNMKIRLMTTKSERMGVRQVGDREEIAKVFREVSEKDMTVSENWNQRYKDNMEKIKTGKLSDVTEVVKNLDAREKQRGLSSVEKKMLNTARQIVLSEIIFSYDIGVEKAEELLANLLLNC